MANHEHSEGQDHPEFLHHHFESAAQQFDSDKMGMWLFLMTEILMFGGLFVAYSVYRANHPEIFIYAHQYLDKTLGGINTLVLITSSFTMAWAVRAAQLNQRKLLITLLALTLLGGFGFMGIKAVEYNHKIKHGLLFGNLYRSQEAHGEHGAEADATSGDASGEHSSTANPCLETLAVGAEDAGADPETPSAMESPESDTPDPGQFVIEKSKITPAATAPQGLARMPDTVTAESGKSHSIEEPRNVKTFFAVYFAMTGLHALHVMAGMVVITIMLVLSIKGKFNSQYYTPVDLTGLFWHLVDLIWIFLFPLLYLIG